MSFLNLFKPTPYSVETKRNLKKKSVREYLYDTPDWVFDGRITRGSTRQIMNQVLAEIDDGFWDNSGNDALIDRLNADVKEIERATSMLVDLRKREAHSATADQPQGEK